MSTADPTPDPPSTKQSSRPKNKDNAWVQVGRYSQLALILPCATVVGYLLGGLFDRWMHTAWIKIIGLFLGSAAGLLEIIRTVLRDSK